MDDAPLLYAEDLPVGSTVELGSHEVTLAEMLEFARQWDPQGFHTDPDAAAAGHFGEVIASGIHTLGIYQRLSVAGAIGGWAVVAGRQIRELRFPAPVVAGDVLHASLLVESVTPGRADASGRAPRALAVVHARVRRDDGTTVLSATFETYVRTRPVT
ncbi:hypothetical protein ASG49_00585 [Marmoricola sp. Leaf446]|uniref:MaoC/PaaZ C-terminal domain-containing protein n=1 Tax=Marmoricola sp. Leaf446 TaxID=1736379 RepID=UPI0006FF3EC9|nr:MaoC/PaaZ C-terminal domain-containing protein [Marmoricola sp. Leaf446]KQT93544.1 hypothetical protein ASG49_00585 [Marmoricola sp. Leaf446]